MRVLLVIGLSLGLASGCKKAMDALDKDAQVGADEKSKTLQEYLRTPPPAQPSAPPMMAGNNPQGNAPQAGNPTGNPNVRPNPVMGGNPPPQQQPTPPQPMNPNPGIGAAQGGSGGAAQAVRGAVRRTVSANDLANLRIYIESASLASGSMPGPQQILADVSRDLPGVVKAVQEGSLVLTGIRQREGVWAYEAAALSQANGGMVLTNNGVERMSPQQLQQALQLQR
ncbi:hypothetical protein [Tuwongella immobilis]|uniref:Lipoprotein n=1 Tax=Tuwongella immobilis TaxID=692036 RepID=A0A6C2YHD2_9BACT|nr:hypothetical protein [Tuwongella immobilis]VIP00896.1 unnamed protein product [Tuwongella immobilis]VTR97210.1 unnamed protein product [Tuwongella immobilis]